MVLLFVTDNPEGWSFVVCLCNPFLKWSLFILVHYFFVCLGIFDCVLLILKYLINLFIYFCMWDLDSWNEITFLQGRFAFTSTRVQRTYHSALFESKFSVWHFLDHPADVNLSCRPLKGLARCKNFLRTLFLALINTREDFPAVLWVMD